VKGLINNIIPLVIILSIFTSCILIPSDLNARYEIKREESERLGEPGEDPHIATGPVSSENANVIVTSREDTNLCMVHLRIMFNQLIVFIF